MAAHPPIGRDAPTWLPYDEAVSPSKPISLRTQVLVFTMLGTVCLCIAIISFFGLGTAGPLRTSDRVGGVFFLVGVVVCYQIAYSRNHAGRKMERGPTDDQRPPSQRGVIAGLLISFGGMTAFQSVTALGRTSPHHDAALVGLFVGLLLVAAELWLVRSLNSRKAHAADPGT